MTTILAEAEKLGGAAKGYKFGAEGEGGYYDCSGLIYAASKAVGVYSGDRFTTFTFHTETAFQRITPEQAGVDDIVVWSENSAHGHMGVISGPDMFYSARSVRDGMGFNRISTFHVYPVPPTYYRAIKSDGMQRGQRTLELHTPNMYGDDVRQVQRVVFPGSSAKIDGYYGPATETAVKAWQGKHMGKNEADGKVGPLTRKAMGIAS